MAHILIQKPYHMHAGIPVIAKKYNIWDKVEQNAENFYTIVEVLEIANDVSWECFSEMCVAYGCDPCVMHCHYAHRFDKDVRTDDDFDEIRAQFDLQNHMMRQMEDEDDEEENEFFWMNFEDKYGSEMTKKYHVTS
jgi:hypothetical protein